MEPINENAEQTVINETDKTVNDNKVVENKENNSIQQKIISEVKQEIITEKMKNEIVSELKEFFTIANKEPKITKNVADETPPAPPTKLKL